MLAIIIKLCRCTIYVFALFHKYLHCAVVGAAPFYKALSNEGISASVYLPGQRVAKPFSMETEYYRLAVIVDVACDGNIQFMAEVSQVYL
jgi:hypothetical protein